MPVKFNDEEEFRFYESIRPRSYIIRKRGKSKSLWDVLIIVVAVYNSLTLPMQISFIQVDTYYKESTVLTVIDYFIDFLFFVDIFFGFLTSYQDVFTGDEIFAPRLIAKRYLKGDFIIDFLSTYPFELTGRVFGIMDTTYYSIATLCKLMKIMRIRRIPKIISNSNVDMIDKALFKVLNTIFILILYVHCTACLLWAIFQVEKVWIPPLDFMYVETDLYDEDATFTFQYGTVLYHSVINFSLVEIAPRTKLELAAISMMMLVSAMVNANIFGIFAVLLEQINKKQIDFQEEFDNANTAMTNLQIPLDMQEKIRKYLLRTNTTKTQQEEFELFQERISPSLKTEISQLIFKEALVDTPTILATILDLRLAEKISR